MIYSYISMQLIGLFYLCHELAEQIVHHSDLAVSDGGITEFTDQTDQTFVALFRPFLFLSLGVMAPWEILGGFYKACNSRSHPFHIHFTSNHYPHS